MTRLSEQELRSGYRAHRGTVAVNGRGVAEIGQQATGADPCPKLSPRRVLIGGPRGASSGGWQRTGWRVLAQSLFIFCGLNRPERGVGGAGEGAGRVKLRKWPRKGSGEGRGLGKATGGGAVWGGWAGSCGAQAGTERSSRNLGTGVRLSPGPPVQGKPHRIDLGPWRQGNNRRGPPDYGAGAGVDDPRAGWVSPMCAQGRSSDARRHRK